MQILFTASLSGGHIVILWKFVLVYVVVVLPARYYYTHKVMGFFLYVMIVHEKLMLSSELNTGIPLYRSSFVIA